MRRVKVAFASETGNAECLAHEIVRFLNEIGIETKEAITLYGERTSLFDEIDVLLAVVSTWGDGDPPTDAEDFHEWLVGAPPLGIERVHFAVLALGDSNYDYFCQFGKELDAELERHGGKRLRPRLDCDTDYEDHFDGWIRSIASRLATFALDSSEATAA